MNTPGRQETLSRLRSARGHLDAVIRMVEDDRYCIDVLHQLRAVQGGLDRSRRGLLDAHLRTCLPNAHAGGTYDATITELLDAIVGGGSPRARRGRCHQEPGTTHPTGRTDCCTTRRYPHTPEVSRA
jgi:CsoR family transcriptional regulator, copper-sensing transcriptional repressor